LRLPASASFAVLVFLFSVMDVKKALQ